jgi:acyl carrier protein
MKTREQIIAEINAKMADVFEIDEATITPEATISETLELDSISLIDLIGIVQVNYGIKITKNELPAIKTFKDLYDYIEQHQQ